jgi:uncharacterized membrane protein YjfL (UPF0719 family)
MINFNYLLYFIGVSLVTGMVLIYGCYLFDEVTEYKYVISIDHNGLSNDN